MSFAGMRVLSLESRRAPEIEGMIRRMEGVPFVAPSVKERALDDHGDVLRFLERLEAGDFDLVVCMTGAGMGFLRDVISAHMPVERLAAALRRITIVSRGPKPVSILNAMDVPVQVVVPEPNTWKEIVEAVVARPEQRIAVQEYGRPNLEMTAALERLGATVTNVTIYRWEMPDDREPLREAARRLADGKIDVVLFTSSIQLDHLIEIARELRLEREVREALLREVVIASVGPVMTATLESQGFPVDITPTHPKMGALVKAVADLASMALHAKRTQNQAGSP